MFSVECAVVVTMMRGCGRVEDGSDVWAGGGRDGCSDVCSLHSGVGSVKHVVCSVRCAVYSVRSAV